MAGTDVPFACDCGTLHGTLLGVSSGNGVRIDCHCSYCRAGELFAGQPDPAPDPVHLFVTTPNRIRIDGGLDHLAVFSFSDKGVLRWQASCCGATLWNTMRTPKVSFVSVCTDRLRDTDALGPVRCNASVRKAGGKTGTTGGLWLLATLARTTLPARFTGAWRDTPLFYVTTGDPVRAVRLVPKADRLALLGDPA